MPEETNIPPPEDRYEMPGRCPACGQDLLVSEMTCPGCRSTITGEFTQGPLARLSREQLEFLLVFVRNRGNIREVERELGISYPTVRGRLDQLVAALGGPSAREGDEANRRREILAALERGELTAAEAVERLRGKGGTR